MKNYFLKRQLVIIGSNWVYKYKNDYYGYPQWKFFDYFATYLNPALEVFLIAPVKKIEEVKKIKGIKLEKLKIIELPFFQGSIDQIKKIYILPEVIYKYYKFFKKADIIIIFTSDIFATIGLGIASFLKKRTVFLIGEDWEKDVKLKYNSDVMCVIVRILRRIQKYFLQYSPYKSLLVTNKKIIEKLNFDNIPIYDYFLSLVSEKEIYYRDPIQLISKKTINILYVGFLIQAKGVQDLIKAISVLKKEGIKNIFLHIVGTGTYEKELKSMAEKENLFVNFYGFIGEREKLKKIYLNSDIFVLPSYSEGYPKVIFEAMAMGVPVIATKVGGIPEIIQHGYNGLLFFPGNISQLATCIKELVFNLEMRKNIINNAYKILKQNYTMEASINRFVKIFEKELNLRINLNRNSKNDENF